MLNAWKWKNHSGPFRFEWLFFTMFYMGFFVMVTQVWIFVTQTGKPQKNSFHKTYPKRKIPSTKGKRLNFGAPRKKKLTPYKHLERVKKSRKKRDKFLRESTDLGTFCKIGWTLKSRNFLEKLISIFFREKKLKTKWLAASVRERAKARGAMGQARRVTAARTSQKPFQGNFSNLFLYPSSTLGRNARDFNSRSVAFTDTSSPK